MRGDVRYILSSVEWVRSIIHHGRGSRRSSYAVLHVGIEFCGMCGHSHGRQVLKERYERDLWRENQAPESLVKWQDPLIPVT